MNLSADAFTALTYGLLALVAILYLVLIRAFFTTSDETQEE